VLLLQQLFGRRTCRGTRTMHYKRRNNIRTSGRKKKNRSKEEEKENEEKIYRSTHITHT